MRVPPVFKEMFQQSNLCVCPSRDCFSWINQENIVWVCVWSDSCEVIRRTVYVCVWSTHTLFVTDRVRCKQRTRHYGLLWWRRQWQGSTGRERERDAHSTNASFMTKCSRELLFSGHLVTKHRNSLSFWSPLLIAQKQKTMLWPVGICLSRPNVEHISWKSIVCIILITTQEYLTIMTLGQFMKRKTHASRVLGSAREV